MEWIMWLSEKSDRMSMDVKWLNEIQDDRIPKGNRLK